MCIWVDSAPSTPTNPGTVDPTKPVTQEGRCQISSAITSAIGTATTVGPDVCSPIKDKSACYQMNGQCEWTTTPITVDPTNPGTVDPTKPVTQEGRCQLVAGSSTATGTVDICPPIKDKSACY
jgi:hypothetical protein